MHFHQFSLKIYCIIIDMAKLVTHQQIWEPFEMKMWRKYVENVFL